MSDNVSPTDIIKKHTPVKKSFTGIENQIDLKTNQQAFHILTEGQAITLHIQLKTNDCYSLPYSYLTSVKFNPSEGITLKFTSHTVHMKGRNLWDVYEGLDSHRLKLVKEGDAIHDNLPENETFFDKIEVKELE